MILVRHGLMIVGDPIGGKSSAFKSLAKSLGDLNEQGLMDEFKVRKLLSEVLLVEKVVRPSSFKMELSPNPADAETKLSFNIEQKSDITVGVFNLSGQQMSSNKMGSMSAGTHRVNVDVQNLSTGIYMVKLNVNNQAATVKLTVK